VEIKDGVLIKNVSAMMDGMESCAIQNFAILVATNMDSVKMEHVFASQAGMENTVLSKDVPEGKSVSIRLESVTNILTSYSCSSHGQCRVGGEGLFECRCNDGWDGIDCSLPLEKDCKDGKDNDKGKNLRKSKTLISI
jgi:hypothetical protein